MLADHGFTVMLPARNVERARHWYETIIGLRAGDVGDYGVRYTLPGGTPMFLYETQFAGTAQHTLLSIDTDDLARDMAFLRDRGVRFEHYDLPNLKTVEGVADFGPVKNAWFRDSEGNIIGLVEGM